MANNLPLQSLPCIGRSDELPRLGDLVAQPNIFLVTIEGAGGMGKREMDLRETAVSLLAETDAA